MVGCVACSREFSLVSRSANSRLPAFSLNFQVEKFNLKVITLRFRDWSRCWRDRSTPAQLADIYTFNVTRVSFSRITGQISYWIVFRSTVSRLYATWSGRWLCRSDIHIEKEEENGWRWGVSSLLILRGIFDPLNIYQNKIGKCEHSSPIGYRFVSIIFWPDLSQFIDILIIQKIPLLKFNKIIFSTTKVLK